jgi:hypothetical protein
MTAFGTDVLRLTVDLLPLLLAFPLARLARGVANRFLVILNLCLFMELLTTLVDSGYRFGDLLLARLVASGLQIGVAVAAIVLWRRWRSATESVTVH